jgi:hypothetical protein
VKSIVRLRDALAHGRAFGFGSLQRGYLTMVKFGRKRDGQNRVQVTMVVDMTERWFIENIELLQVAIGKVTAALDYETRDLNSQN